MRRFRIVQVQKAKRQNFTVPRTIVIQWEDGQPQGLTYEGIKELYKEQKDGRVKCVNAKICRNKSTGYLYIRGTGYDTVFAPKGAVMPLKLRVEE